MTQTEFEKLSLVDTYRFAGGYTIEVREREDGTFWAGRCIKKKITNILQVRKCRNGFEAMGAKNG